MRLHGLLALVLLLFCSADLCAQTPSVFTGEESMMTGEGEETDGTEFYDPFAEKGAEVEVADPLQPLNRGIFWVNDRLYFYLFKPVARAYRVAPEPFRESVGRFFTNLGAPVRFTNCLLQFKFTAAGNELRRFVANSTVGVAGFFDPAERWGWERSNEDFGQTLGLYGVGSGFYLVLPVLGPANLRDGAGRVGDAFLNPVPYMVDGTPEVIGVQAYEQVNALSLDDDTYEKIKKESLDPYLFVRNAYQQRREALINK